MFIKHNMSALNTQRQQKINRNFIAKNSEKLASGYRINRAADDAAGLSISDKMRRQIRGLDQGAENIQDGVSVCKIMDGSLTEVHDILHRMTELSVKSANGTWAPQERFAIDLEIRELKAELNRLTANTSFNEMQLCSPTDLQIGPSFQPGSGQADIIFVIDNTGSMGSHVNNVKNNLHSFADSLRNCDVRYGVIQYGEKKEGSHKVFPFTSSVTETKAYLDTIHCTGGGDRNESALEALDAAANFPFRPDVAREIILVTDAPYHDKNGDHLSNFHDKEIAELLKNMGIHLSVVTTLGTQSSYTDTLVQDGKVFNIDGGSFHESFMDIAKDVATTAGEKIHKNPADIVIQMNGEARNTYTIRTYNITTTTLGLDAVSCLTQESSSESIDMIAKATDKISTIRATIGVDQNALEHAYNNNTNASENTQAAESRIRDMDMAAGMVMYSMHNILEQSIHSMLAQANQANQEVMNLLA